MAVSCAEDGEHMELVNIWRDEWFGVGDGRSTRRSRSAIFVMSEVIVGYYMVFPSLQ